MFAPATPWEVDAHERSRHGACSFRPLYGRPARSNATSSSRPPDLPDPSEITPARLLVQTVPEHQLSPTQPVVRCSETEPPPPPWWVIKHSGAGVSRNNQPSDLHQFPAITSMFHTTFLTILLLNPSTAQFLSKPSDLLLLRQPRGRSQRNDGWASPPHFQTRAAYRSS